MRTHAFAFKSGPEGEREPAAEQHGELGDVRFRALMTTDDWASLPGAIGRRFSERLAAGDTVVYVGEIVESHMSRGGWCLAQAVRLIGENLRKLGETGVAKVVRADATRPPPAREPCDLVFLDPPYRSGQAAPALAALDQAGWLAPGAIVTVELAHNEDIVPPAGFEAIDERRYGAAKIAILRKPS